MILTLGITLQLHCICIQHPTMSSQRSISAILSTCTTSRCSRNAILRRTRKFQHSKRSFAALAKSQNPLESEEASYGSIVGGLDSANRLEAIRRLLEEDVGGSQLWLTRVKNAQSSLTITRRPSIGGELACVLPKLNGSLRWAIFTIAKFRLSITARSFGDRPAYR